MQPPSFIHVRVNHEDPLLAAGLATILGGQPGIQVSTEPGDADVLVTDYLGGLERLTPPPDRRPARAVRHSRVLIVAAHHREWDVRSALDRGIGGFLLQSCRPEELVDSVRAVGRGSRYICAAVARSLAEGLACTALTERENEVLRQLSQGRCNKSIASDMCISVGTVKSHVRAILQKLQATSRTHAVSMAAARGLVAEREAR